MKPKLFLLLLGCLLFNAACSDDDDNVDDSYIDVYIVGYEPCGNYSVDATNETGVAKCYYFITADFKDTIKSSVFPEEVLKLPMEYFDQIKSDAVAFPDKYDYDEIKARIKFSMIPEEDWVYYTCTQDINLATRFHAGPYKQVKIEAVSELKFK